MSLKLSKALEVTAYGSAVIAASGIAGAARIAGQLNNGQGGSAVYHYGRDRLYVVGLFAAFNDIGLLKLDPDFFLTTPSDGVLALDQDTVLFSNGHLCLGQFDPGTGQQRLYCHPGSGTDNLIHEVNVDTLVTNGAALSSLNGSVQFTNSDIASGTEGGWQSSTHRFCMFEGLTDGIAGETVLTGANVYPRGLMLQHVSSGFFNGSTCTDVFAWIDLNTRRLVGFLGGLPPVAFPAATVTAPIASQFQTEPPIAGDTFNWAASSFTPDADSTDPKRPKGELFLQSDAFLPSFGVTPNPGDTTRHYVRLTDFNPFGLPSASGIVTRTHGRSRLTSRLLCTLNPIFNQAGASFVTSPSTNKIAMFWDPLRKRFGQFLHRNGTFAVTVGENYVGLFSRAVDPVIVSAPAARSVPRTADVTDYECFVGGDLAEPAVGQVVAWSLSRRSSEGELLTIAGGIGTTSTVAHPAIDTNPSGVVDLALTANGVALALTTDYTVVGSTGVITWVTSQVGKTVLATYRHRATDATPAHGTLLIGQSETDENGVARTQVSWQDNDDLVGTIDALSSALG